jgi:hypothetical protein
MDDAKPKKRNHLVWVGALLSLFGLVSYFTIFARFAVLRDFPWLNLPLVLIGLGLSIWALQRRLSPWSAIGALMSAACAALLVGYVFILSDQLPDVATVIEVGAPAPAFSLSDHTGATVELADFEGKPLVLVFYRGFW